MKIIVDKEKLLQTAVNELICLEAKMPDDKDLIRSKLNNICRIIINSGRFVFWDGSPALIPVWVEAYYCNEKQNYIDPTMDCVRKKNGKWVIVDDIQNGSYGSLYHHGSNNYKRVDILLSRLSNHDYRLSILIKACWGQKGPDNEGFSGQATTADTFAEKDKSIRLVIEEGSNASLANTTTDSKRVFRCDLKSKGEKEKEYILMDGLAVYRKMPSVRAKDTPVAQYEAIRRNGIRIGDDMVNSIIK